MCLLIVGYVSVFVCLVCTEKSSKPLPSVFTVGEEMGHQIFDVIFRLPSILSEDSELRPDLGAANYLPLLSGFLL